MLKPRRCSTSADRALVGAFGHLRFRKKQKKSGLAQPPAGKGGSTMPGGSEKGASTMGTAPGAVLGGKTSARPAMISARGAPNSDRPSTKVEGVTVDDTEK